MTKTNKLKCLNALDLKFLAMALMLCDHLWATVIPGGMWLTNVGRLAFPIFAFQLVEGYAHTRDFKKYIKRMFLFALISEIPFNLMYGGGVIFPFHQNVLFSFCISLVILRLLDKAKGKGIFPYVLTLALSILIGYHLGFLTFVDYYGFGIITVILFYFFRGFPFAWVGQLFGMVFINGYLMAGLTIPVHLMGMELQLPQQLLGVLALIPIWMYNGKQGAHSKGIQYACYAFYPVHILILALIALAGR